MSRWDQCWLGVRIQGPWELPMRGISVQVTRVPAHVCPCKLLGRSPKWRQRGTAGLCRRHFCLQLEFSDRTKPRPLCPPALWLQLGPHPAGRSYNQRGDLLANTVWKLDQSNWVGWESRLRLQGSNFWAKHLLTLRLLCLTWVNTGGSLRPSRISPPPAQGRRRLHTDAHPWPEPEVMLERRHPSPPPQHPPRSCLQWVGHRKALPSGQPLSCRPPGCLGLRATGHADL